MNSWHAFCVNTFIALHGAARTRDTWRRSLTRALETGVSPFPIPDDVRQGLGELYRECGVRWMRGYGTHGAAAKVKPTGYRVDYNPHVRLMGGLGWKIGTAFASRAEARGERDRIKRAWPGMPVRIVTLTNA